MTCPIWLIDYTPHHVVHSGARWRVSMMAEEFALIAFFAVVSLVGVTSLFLVTTKLRL